MPDTAARRALIQSILLDQEQRYQRGEPRAVEAYLAELPELAHHSDDVLELIYHDFLLREQAGEVPTREEYERRFPNLVQELRDQFDVLAAWRSVEWKESLAAPPLPMITQLDTGVTIYTDNAPGPAPPLSPPGYEILRELGQGGMGVVYQALQLPLNRVVALKMIKEGEYASDEDRRRFLAEAKAIAGVSHKGIVQVYDYDTHAGRPYFAMEFCAGGSLHDHLKGTPLPGREAAELVEALADALQAAHDAKIVHRDLKPANVLIQRGTTKHTKDTKEDQEGSGGTDSSSSASLSCLSCVSWLDSSVPKITDFGLAKRLDAPGGQTLSGHVLGTPSYMPPEQARGQKDVGYLADVYALGATFYECLTGRPPFRAATVYETILQVIAEDPVPPRQLNPAIPADLETICLKCLHKTPSRRYPSARELADDLRRWLDHKPIHARPARWHEHLRKWVRRRPAMAALLAVSSVAVVGLLALTTALLLTLAKAGQLTFDLSRVQDEIRKGEAQVRHLEQLRLHAAYSSSLRDARVAFQAGDYLRGRQLLDGLTSDPDLKPLRGFEWHYWHRVYHAERRSFAGAGFVAVSPDGKQVVTGSERAVVFRDPGTGREVSRFTPHPATPTAAAFSSDGKHLAVTYADGVVAFCELDKDAPPTLRRDHAGEAKHVSASRDGRFATCGADQVIRVWTLPVGKGEPQCLRGHEAGVTSTAFSPDGKLLVSLGGDGPRVWDLATSKLKYAIPGDEAVTAVAFSPKSPLVYVARLGERGNVETWNAETGMKEDSFPHQTPIVHTLAMQSDDAVLATAGLDGYVRLWNPATGEAIRTLPGHTDEVVGLVFGQDGSLFSIGKEGWVKAWDLNVPRPEERFLNLFDDGLCKAVAFANEGPWLAVGSAAGTVLQVDRTTREPRLPAWRAKGNLLALGFGAAGKHLVAATAGQMEGEISQIFTWQADTGQQHGPVVRPAGPLTHVAIAGGLVALTGEDGQVHLRDDAGHPLRSLDHGQAVGVLALSPDGKRLAVAGNDSLVKVHNVEDLRAAPPVIAELRLPAKLTQVCFSADGERLACACEDKTIHVWTIGTDKVPLRLQTPGHTMGVEALAFSPDGSRLASGSTDRTVRVWDTFAGGELLKLEVKWNWLASVAFSPDGKQLVAGGGWGDRGEVVVWDTSLPGS